MASRSSEGSAPTRTYEIQRLSAGRWLLDSVSDDKEMAIAVAKSLMEAPRAAVGVRVMAVQQNQKGQFSEVTVFRATPTEASASPEPQRKPKPEPEAKPPREARELKTVAPPPEPKKKRFKDVILAVQVAFGIGVTLVALQALRIMRH